MNKCIFDGCVNDKAVKGYCRGHYAQLTKGKELRPLRTYATRIPASETGRTCTKCSEYKPWDEFYDHINGINKKAPSCKSCVKTEAIERYRKV